MVGQGDKPGLHVRMFGSAQFFHLWLSQVLSSIGDWLGFFAIAALAAQVADESSPEAAIGLVMSARIVPGFFLGATSGVIADRFDRKKLMVGCNIGRAAVLVCLPFVDTVFGLVFASLLLECFTLLWTPAKEASVPNLVPPDHLTTANSLSLVAAYGTMPLAGAIFSVLASVSKAIGEIDALDDVPAPTRWRIAFYVNAARLPRVGGDDLAAAAAQAREAPDARRSAHRLRAGLPRAEGGLVVHLHQPGGASGERRPGHRPDRRRHARAARSGVLRRGPRRRRRRASASSSSRSGTGVAVGVVLLSVFQRHIPKAAGLRRVGASAPGSSLIVAASMSALGLAALFVGVLGVCAGSVYVLGFTLLHENVDDELRGRIFSALYTLVRFCVLLAFAVGPFLSGLLDDSSERCSTGEITVAGLSIVVPGVRLTLWLAGLIIVGAGVLATVSLRSAAAVAPTPRTASALDELLLQEGAELVSGLTGPFTEVRRSHEQDDATARRPAAAPSPTADDDG